MGIPWLQHEEPLDFFHPCSLKTSCVNVKETERES